ncbi:hypothetical protein RI570_21320 [Brucella pseudogrignonensis]|uniref:hypothetical protein n=1 Tax=Brucella pseudogrignonensis TaxID=419475 RepID=UPI0028B605A3|nr:hypothetical protein [Brucella pseudogrignonensis]MDT6940784.1 hypothetical protein [Brucella pseudogrignonensis]MDT6942593.1 hypothetical protein [Brucella pseudogrignonensis]
MTPTIPDEAVQAASKRIDEYYDTPNCVGETAVRAALTAALPFLQGASPRAQALEEGDLNARLKAKGMYSIDEMMGTLPVDKWLVHSGMTDIKFFGEWLERKTREYLTMKAEYDAGNKDERDELYEWVLAHYGAFRDVLVNFRAALSSQPVASTRPAGGSDHGE